jgi:hypothetical protein
MAAISSRDTCGQGRHVPGTMVPVMGRRASYKTGTCLGQCARRPLSRTRTAARRGRSKQRAPGPAIPAAGTGRRHGRRAAGAVTPRCQHSSRRRSTPTAPGPPMAGHAMTRRVPGRNPRRTRLCRAARGAASAVVGAAAGYAAPTACRPTSAALRGARVVVPARRRSRRRTGHVLGHDTLPLARPLRRADPFGGRRNADDGAQGREADTVS